MEAGQAFLVPNLLVRIFLSEYKAAKTQEWETAEQQKRYGSKRDLKTNI